MESNTLWYVCKYCNRAFPSNETLKFLKHKLTNHSEELRKKKRPKPQVLRDIVKTELDSNIEDAEMDSEKLDSVEQTLHRNYSDANSNSLNSSPTKETSSEEGDSESACSGSGSNNCLTKHGPEDQNFEPAFDGIRYSSSNKCCGERVTMDGILQVENEILASFDSDPHKLQETLTVVKNSDIVNEIVGDSIDVDEQAQDVVESPQPLLDQDCRVRTGIADQKETGISKLTPKETMNLLGSTIVSTFPTSGDVLSQGQNLSVSEQKLELLIPKSTPDFSRTEPAESQLLKNVSEVEEQSEPGVNTGARDQAEAGKAGTESITTVERKSIPISNNNDQEKPKSAFSTLSKTRRLVSKWLDRKYFDKSQVCYAARTVRKVSRFKNISKLIKASILLQITFLRKRKFYQCRHCHVVFKMKKYSRDLIEAHMNHHKNLSPHLCSKCDRQFRTAWLLQRHKQTHKNKHKLICSACNRLFPTYWMQCCHGKENEVQTSQSCNFCFVNIFGKCALKIHQRTCKDMKKLSLEEHTVQPVKQRRASCKRKTRSSSVRIGTRRSLPQREMQFTPLKPKRKFQRQKRAVKPQTVKSSKLSIRAAARTVAKTRNTR